MSNKEKGPNGECADCEIGAVKNGAREMQIFLTNQIKELEAKLSTHSPVVENKNLKYFIEDLRTQKWLSMDFEPYVHSSKYGVLSGGEESKWTNDPNWAYAFPTKKEADDFYNKFYASMPDYAVTEHEFVSAPSSPVVEGGLRWVSIVDGCEMPAIDEFVLWLREDGNYFVKEIDKDDGPWWKGEEGTGNPFQVKCTHWARITNPLNL
jgi:hypothetical protein